MSDAVLLIATRFVLHELLIAVIMVITTPVTLMLLARTALYRDRREGSGEVPPPMAPRAGRAGTELPRRPSGIPS